MPAAPSQVLRVGTSDPDGGPVSHSETEGKAEMESCSADSRLPSGKITETSPKAPIRKVEGSPGWKRAVLVPPATWTGEGREGQTSQDILQWKANRVTAPQVPGTELQVELQVSKQNKTKRKTPQKNSEATVKGQRGLNTKGLRNKGDFTLRIR